MKRPISKLINSIHIPGIIPIAGIPLDFEFPWHDSMQPIAQDFLAVERAVLECATAGCKTIWIICPANIQPLLKHRIGEYVLDPYFYGRSLRIKKYKVEGRKYVPIYYVPAHPKDKDKRDSLVWSILYGAKIARNISVRLSKWMVPAKYYIAFPYGVFPSQYLVKYRHKVAYEKRFFVSFNGKTIRDGEFLSCSLGEEDIKILRKEFRQQATGIRAPLEDGIDPKSTHAIKLKNLPFEERYSGRFLTVGDIFSKLNMDESYCMSVPWYHNISSWNGLCEYLGSEDRHKMHRPKTALLRLRPESYWNGIGAYGNDETIE